MRSTCTYAVLFLVMLVKMGINVFIGNDLKNVCWENHRWSNWTVIAHDSSVKSDGFCGSFWRSSSIFQLWSSTLSVCRLEWFFRLECFYKRFWPSILTVQLRSFPDWPSTFTIGQNGRSLVEADCFRWSFWWSTLTVFMISQPGRS